MSFIKNLKTTSFRVGDMVRCRFTFPLCPKKGWLGKVIAVSEEKQIISIEWEQSFKKGNSNNKNRRNYSTEDPMNFIDLDESIYTVEKTIQTKRTFIDL